MIGCGDMLAPIFQNPGGRVREWRLGIVRLVSIPCHLEPDVRFSLIRLSDNLLLGVFKTSIASAFDNLPRQVRHCISISWLSSIARAGILVICLVVELAFRHAPSLTSSLNLVEVETLPSE
jgi:hypothetical protein